MELVGGCVITIEPVSGWWLLDGYWMAIGCGDLIDLGDASKFCAAALGPGR
jgi:hypothetical protein